MNNRRFNVLAFVAGAALACSVASVRADITGSVKLEGKAPDAAEINMSGVPDCKNQHADPVYEETVVAGDKGELANVVIALKVDDAAALGGSVPEAPAVLDQKGCTYHPHVLAMMVGQKMLVKNDDPFMHNVHSQAQTNAPFNMAQPNKDEGKPVEPPKAAETYKIKCDVHPWMGAWVAVFEHPFFAVTGEDGKFDIKGTVPDGEYTIVAWHEKYSTQEGKVTVKDGKGEVNFTFKAEGARGLEDPNAPKLASAKTAPAAMSCCGDCGEKSEKPGNATAAAK